MKKYLIIAVVCFIATSYTLVTPPGPDDPVFIPPSLQRTGNADSGLQYIVTGDYVNSGLPLLFYRMGLGMNKEDFLQRDGKNAGIRYDFNVVNAPNGEDIVVPNCLQCHAQVFDNKLIMGLGNANADFTAARNFDSGIMQGVIESYFKVNKKKGEAAKEFMQVGKTIADKIYTEVRGVNPADRLTAVLISHRDKNTLKWKDTASTELPEQIIPSDVPAWWLLKKKNAMFYSGFGRGDFGRFLMGAILLTVNDTTHANKVNEHMADVLAFIKHIDAPKYPKAINKDLADKGQVVFETHCAKCHGFYGEDASYPNYLIPQHVIKTDSLLNHSNYQYSEMINWFNTSWFSKGDNPARLVPFNGYIAPPLDGVWITAPYLHNGSVPTLEAMLNSKLRPAYWSRNFSKTEYDYEKLGWKYKEEEKAGGRSVYNTTLPGYNNMGHYFGDKLTDDERVAVLEYLKTL
jgi:mono/diheme cytochrome c family protein